MARRISRASKRRLSLFGTLSVVAIIYCAFSLIYNVYQIINLTNQKYKLEKYYSQLQENAEELKIDIDKLNDKEYLANYARENYLYSKDGEYVLKIEDSEEDSEIAEETINILNKEINKNYLIISLSAIVLLIFISVFIKGRK